MSASTHAVLGEPVRVGRHLLANRLVGTAHASGAVREGLAIAGDAQYWARAAAGGAAMLTVGGTVVSPHSSNRSGNLTEAWRPASVKGLRARAQAIRAENVIAACQLVHLGRETLGAESWRHPVAPSPVRSPREFTTPRALTDAEVDGVIADFVRSARHAEQAGFQVIELHAAHGYLLAQFLSPVTNQRPGADDVSARVVVLQRIVDGVRAACPGVDIGVRLSLEPTSRDSAEAGLDLTELRAVLRVLRDVDYVNVTVGVRTTYVRDMAGGGPPLLDQVADLRAACPGVLLVSHAFRDVADMATAVARGADLIGVARPLIADPDLPVKLLSGRANQVRPCVSCNEDCRTFDPVLLCSVNPGLSVASTAERPAEPLVLDRRPSRTRAEVRSPADTGSRVGAGSSVGAPCRVVVVGAGPAGLECAHQLARQVDAARGSIARHDIVLYDAAGELGGALAIAAKAPHRRGWVDLITFYTHNLPGVDVRLNRPITPADLDGVDEVVVATGAREVPPAVDGVEHALLSTPALRAGPGAFATAGRVVVLDDGAGGWAGLGVLELALAAGAEEVVFVTPAPAVAAGIPAESRVQLLRRLARAPVQIRVLSTAVGIDEKAILVRNLLSGGVEEIPAGRVVVVGERRTESWEHLSGHRARVQVIGDALVPRRVSHAVAEGRAAAIAVLETSRPPGRGADLEQEIRH